MRPLPPASRWTTARPWRAPRWAAAVSTGVRVRTRRATPAHRARTGHRRRRPPVERRRWPGPGRDAAAAAAMGPGRLRRRRRRRARRLRRNARACRPLPRHRAGAVGIDQRLSRRARRRGPRRRDRRRGRHPAGGAAGSVPRRAVQRGARRLDARRPRTDGDGRRDAWRARPAAGRRRRRVHRSDDRGRHPPGAGRSARSPPRSPTPSCVASCEAEAAPGVLARRRRAAFAAKWRFNRAVRGLVGSGALGAATVVARAWPRLVEALVCYAGDVPDVRRPAVGGRVPVAVSIARPPSPP